MCLNLLPPFFAVGHTWDLQSLSHHYSLLHAFGVGWLCTICCSSANVNIYLPLQPWKPFSSHATENGILSDLFQLDVPGTVWDLL